LTCFGAGTGTDRLCPETSPCNKSPINATSGWLPLCASDRLGNGLSSLASMSGDGRRLAFQTHSNLRGRISNREFARKTGLVKPRLT